VVAFEPSCLNCKYYIQYNSNPDLGLCKRFKDLSYDDKQYMFTNKLAITCRNNEELCGLYGNYFQDDLLNTQIVNNKKSNFEDKDEVEQLERDFFEIFQKIKKHNKRLIYKKTNDLYKLFRRSE
jgi:hypothetical protein